MTFLVDANVVVYSAVDSPYRPSCLELLSAIARGAADGRTSSAILEEVWYVELSGRAGDLDGLTRRAYALFTPLLPVGDTTFAAALALDAPSLGSNDRIHVATCRENAIETIVSADADFDGVAGLSRVDPLDCDAMNALGAAR